MSQVGALTLLNLATAVNSAPYDEEVRVELENHRDVPPIGHAVVNRQRNGAVLIGLELKSGRRCQAFDAERHFSNGNTTQGFATRSDWLRLELEEWIELIQSRVWKLVFYDHRS